MVKPTQKNTDSGKQKKQVIEKFENLLSHLDHSLTEEDSICVPTIKGYDTPERKILPSIQGESLTEETEVEIEEEETIKELKPVVLQIEWSEERQSLVSQYLLEKQTFIDTGMLCALARSAPLCSTLCVLRLVRCNLSTALIVDLARAISITHFVKELEISWNPMTYVGAAALVKSSTGLEYLTLKECELNDQAAESIAYELTWPPGSWLEMSSLLALNLNLNAISCDGACYLANALRSNRTLKALCLAGNYIWNRGALAFTEVLQRFPLSFDEIKTHRERYIMKLEKYSYKFDDAEDEEDKMEDVRKKYDVEEGDKEEEGEEENIEEEIEETQKKMIDEHQDQHPFSSEIAFGDGEVFCTGNTCLEYLNLKHNDLSYESLEEFKNVIDYQKGLQLTDAGLQFLELKGPSIPEDEELYIYIQNILKNKDEKEENK